MELFIATALGGSLLILLSGVYVALSRRRVPEARLVKERLDRWSSAPSPVELTDIVRSRVLSEIPRLHKLLTRISVIGVLERMLQQASWQVSVGAFLMLSALLAALTALPVLILGEVPLWGALAGGAFGGLVPTVYARWMKKQRLQRLERQLPEALDGVARTLRAGHTFMVGMQMVGEEFSNPIAGEFRKTSEEISLGMSVTEALENLSARVDCPDLRMFVTSVLVQRETGGNLTEILESISGLVRERFELQARVRSLSAEGRLSAIVLFALPFALALIISVISPTFLDPLFTHPMGQRLAIGAAVLMLVGAWVTKKLVTIRV